MNRSVFYLVAIALHLAVLLWVFPSEDLTSPSKTKSEDKYVEVTLSSEPGPARAGPDSGPDDKAKSAVAPGPIVVDSPPPVASIALEVTPPAPAPPSPDAPSLAVLSSSPSAPTSTPDSPPAPIGPLAHDSAPPPSTDNGTTSAGSPVSGTGQGNALQWSRGKGGNGHYYQAVYTPDGISWVDAQKYALLHGGYLATITSAAENNAVYFLVSDPKFWCFTVPGQYSGPWFGGFNTTEQWYWLNHEGALSYTNWYPSEPEERPNPRILYGLHFYTEGAPADGALVAPGSRFGNFPFQRGVQPGQKIAQPGSTWDVSRAQVLLLGFVVEYNSDPSKLKPNPKAAENFTGTVSYFGF